MSSSREAFYYVRVTNEGCPEFEKLLTDEKITYSVIRPGTYHFHCSSEKMLELGSSDLVVDLNEDKGTQPQKVTRSWFLQGRKFWRQRPYVQQLKIIIVILGSFGVLSYSIFRFSTWYNSKTE